MAYKLSMRSTISAATRILSRSILKNARKVAVKVGIKVRLKAAIPISASSGIYLLVRGLSIGWWKY